MKRQHQHQRQRHKRAPRQSGKRANRPFTCATLSEGGGGGGDEQDNEMEEWHAAMESVFAEALISYYEHAPLFDEREFNALRDEIDHLSKSQMRLGQVENLWMKATSARDFDRRLQKTLEMTEEEYTSLKKRVIAKNPQLRQRSRARRLLPPRRVLSAPEPVQERNARDAQRIEWKSIDSRLKWFIFGDAVEEKLKVAMLYFPGVLISLVVISILTLLFANLDGEMHITVSHKGQVRLGVLTWAVIFSTAWFSDKVTPIVLDFLDLGQPTLLRGSCPNCTSSISCLFTGALRVRDERKCKVCGAIVGFNRKWSKVYLVDQPGADTTKSYSNPD